MVDSVRELAQISSTKTTVLTPIDSNKPIFRIAEISTSAVDSIISFFRNSRTKYVFGPDTVFLKRHKYYLIAPIVHLVNLSIKYGFFASAWKSAAVKPVLQYGDPTLVENVRPKSILPVCHALTLEILLFLYLVRSGCD